jgi:hypothetical protein
MISFLVSQLQLLFNTSHYQLLPQCGTLSEQRVSPRGWPTGLVHNLQIHKQEQPSSVGDRYCPTLSQGRVLVARVSVMA